MKISNWCRKLATALAAGGLIAPCLALAGDLNRNLVINGTFENVDLATFDDAYNGPKILNWTGPNAFAYSHDMSASNGGSVPDYADGADPPAAGHWYFSSNNTDSATGTDIRTPNEFYQDIAVGSGDTASVIAAGQGRYRVSAYMSSYLNDADFGNVHVDFRNGIGASIGSVNLSDSDVGPNNVWSLNSTVGAVPIGTATLRVSLYGTPDSFGADGFIDNVSLMMSGVPGDYNLNGTVDAADYTVWRNSLGSASDSRADGSGSVAGVPDGVVNRLDYDFWKTHYGDTFGSGAGVLTSVEGFSHQAVPEPASFVLTCVAAGAAFCFFAARNGKA